MNISQVTARSALIVALAASPAALYPPNHFDTLINSAPQAAQVGTIVVDTAANSTAYTVTLNGETVAITSDASATKPEIAAALADAINQDPTLRAAVAAVSNGVDTVTVTGLIPGVVITLTDSDANLTTTAAATAADTADSVAFGAFVMVTGFESQGGNKIGGAVQSGLLAAQVDTVAVTYAAGNVYGLSIDVAGESYGVEVAADTDSATTAAAIRTAINAVMPANTVIAAGSSGNVTLTAEVAGKAFALHTWTKTGSGLATTHTTATAACDLAKVIAGLALLTTDEEVSATGAGAYPANSGVKALKVGDVWVSSSESPAYGDPVYVETSGTDTGKPYAASSATRIRLPLTLAQWRAPANADGLALLHLSLPL